MATTTRRAGATRRTTKHPAAVVAFTELDEAFFRAGDLLSETGKVSGDQTLDEMYAPVSLRHRMVRAVRNLFRASPVAQPARRAAPARQLSQQIEICG